MKKLNKLLLPFLLVSGLQLYANEVSLAINNSDIKISLEKDLPSGNIDSLNKFSIFAETIVSDDKSKTDTFFEAGLKTKNVTKEEKFDNFYLGIKTIISKYNNNDTYLATPLIFGYQKEFNKYLINASLSYAPKVLSFKDLENYKETNLYLGYEIITNGYLYANYKAMFFNSYNSLHDSKHLYIGYKILF